MSSMIVDTRDPAAGRRLNLGVNLNVISLHEIDTVNQTFNCHFYLKVKSTNLEAVQEDEALLGKLNQFTGLTGRVTDNFDPRLRFLNLSVTHYWNQKNFIRDGVYHLHVECHATFREELELQNFPFDAQRLEIDLSSAFDHDTLTLAQAGDGVINLANFTSANVFALRDVIVFKADETNPNESTRGVVRPMLHMRMRVRRKPSYFMWNICVPLQMISALAFGSFSVPREDVGSRLETSLTMVLTAAAFKSVVSGDVPNVAYLTMIDSYVLSFFCLTGLVAVENIFAKNNMNDEGDLACFWLLVGLYIVITLGWIIRFNVAFCQSKSGVDKDKYSKNDKDEGNKWEYRSGSRQGRTHETVLKDEQESVNEEKVASA